MLDEFPAVNDANQEPGINSVLSSSENKQLGCANTVLLRKNCLVEIRAEFPVEHITLFETELRTLNVRCSDPPPIRMNRQDPTCSKPT